MPVAPVAQHTLRLQTARRNQLSEHVSFFALLRSSYAYRQWIPQLWCPVAFNFGLMLQVVGSLASNLDSASHLVVFFLAASPGGVKAGKHAIMLSC